jgi:hypothetical protein
MKGGIFNARKESIQETGQKASRQKAGRQEGASQKGAGQKGRRKEKVSG